MTEFTACRLVIGDRTTYGMAPAAPDDRAAEWLAAYRETREEGESPEPVLMSAARDPGVAELLSGEAARSALLVPLLRDERVVALLLLLSVEPEPALGHRRLALARAAAASVTLALRNARLFEEAKSRADNLETIFRISHAVGSSLQTRVVLNRVLDVVQKILSADAVMLMTYDSQRKIMGVPMARGILHRDMLEATFRPGEDVPGRVFETREPERYDRISRADTMLLNAAAAQGLESLLVVPLLARGRSIGVLAVFAREEAAFGADEMDLLRTFASQAALAIDTAEMFSREHQVASVLKESIQPTRLPRVPGVDAAQVYLPAGAEADIGGDYYDLFRAPDGRIVAAIGDVCGKGVVAATKTSMIKYAVRGMVAAGVGPSRILRELNRMLSETGDASNIVTVWLGYIDLEHGEIVYANGGHPPGLVLRAIDRTIERLPTTGALLGAVPDADWTEHTVPIGDGDTLLLYTDGVTEARAGARFFGEGRVRRSLRAGGSADAVAQRLFALVQRFSVGELRDDAAILALVMHPTGERGEGVTPGPASGK
jgi:serine phosphatase RsbU (regulator of sigma subunit)